MNFWTTMTEPQALLISSVATIAAAVIGVTLGAKLFGGRVSGLKDAVQHTDEIIKGHSAHLETQFAAIVDKMSVLGDVERKLQVIDGLQENLVGLDLQLASALENIQKLTNTVNEQPSVAASAEQPEPEKQADLREIWHEIRDHLEKMAADPDLDGRRRAKYARIDRRSYYDLVDSLSRDGYLGRAAELYYKAIEHWNRFRTGRNEPSPGDIAQMKLLRDSLIGSST